MTGVGELSPALVRGRWEHRRRSGVPTMLSLNKQEGGGDPRVAGNFERLNRGGNGLFPGPPERSAARLT